MKGIWTDGAMSWAGGAHKKDIKSHFYLDFIYNKLFSKGAMHASPIIHTVPPLSKGIYVENLRNRAKNH